MNDVINPGNLLVHVFMFWVFFFYLDTFSFLLFFSQSLGTLNEKKKNNCTESNVLTHAFALTYNDVHFPENYFGFLWI